MKRSSSRSLLGVIALAALALSACAGDGEGAVTDGGADASDATLSDGALDSPRVDVPANPQDAPAADAADGAPCGCLVANGEGACVDGGCVVGRCDDGWQDCDGDPANGCEVNVQNDVSHCGMCRAQCADVTAATPVCRGGQCAVGVCAGGHADCDADGSNGCEVDVAADPTNCGACGVACPSPANAVPQCRDGACAFACVPGFADCDGDASNGCEVDTRGDISHCGACGRACAAGNASSTCVRGNCQIGACEAGRGDCNLMSGDGCEADLRGDLTNCGACGTRCPAGQTCNDGVCAPPCPAGQLNCGGTCVVSASDPANCGGCASPCAMNQLCGAGACVGTCASTQRQCGRSCADLSTDANHCGACDARCPTGQACVAGRCACPAGQALCAGRCIDVQSNVDNCGGCAVRCRTGFTCSAGVCRLVCPGRQLACDGLCIDPGTDPENCGACGTRCATGCVEGRCARAADVELSDTNTLVRYTSGRVFGFGQAGGQVPGYPSGVAHLRTPLQLVDSLRRPLESVRRVRVGTRQGCAVTADERLSCWGTTVGPITQVAGLSGVVDVDGLSDNEWYALGRGGEVWTLGVPGVSTPSRAAAVTEPAELAAGFRFACVRRANGTVHCFGVNSSGQCGTGASASSVAAPTAVMGLTDAVAIDAGTGHACAVRATGAVVCWGLDADGQLGDGGSANSRVPVAVPGITDAIAVAAGTYHTCVLTRAGQVRCWGRNNTGQVGNGAPGAAVRSPVTVPMLGAARGLGAALGHSCALLRDDTLRCWGDNSYGQAGGGTERRETPVRVGSLSGVQRVVGGMDRNNPASRCALLSTGAVHCWGASPGNASGQLGDGTTTARTTPGPVQGVTDAVAIAGYAGHFCAIRRDRTVWCWGLNSSGQLGDGSAVNRSAPVATVTNATTRTPLGAVQDLVTGAAFNCARRMDRTVWCWGGNAFGQLGDGSYVARSVPTQVRVGGSPLVAEQLAAGLYHVCARLADGTARCWGRNLEGQLSQFHTRNEPSPSPVLTTSGSMRVPATGFTDVRPSGTATFAMQSARAVYWGGGQDHVSSDPNARISRRSAASFDLATCEIEAGSEVVECNGSNNEWGDVGPQQTRGPGGLWRVDTGYTLLESTGPSDLNPCAINGTGQLFCWGRTHFGALAAAGLDALTRAPANIVLP